MRVRSGSPSGPAPPASSINRSATAKRPPTFAKVLGERVAIGPAPAAAATPPTSRARGVQAPTGRVTSSPPPPSPVRALLERTLGAERRVDTLLAAAARGKTFSPAELLALQASVFRYSQAVEIVSRATDKLVGAVKQTMGTQV
jgi:hypothetical protein